MHQCPLCRMPTEGFREGNRFFLHCEECHLEMAEKERVSEDKVRPVTSGTDRPCHYCGATPSWAVVWSSDGGEREIYLCASCDDAEAQMLLEEGGEILD